MEWWPSGGTVNAMYRLGGDMVIRLPLVQGGAGDVLMEREWLPRLAPHLPTRIPRCSGPGSPPRVSVAVVGVPVAGGGASRGGGTERARAAGRGSGRIRDGDAEHHPAGCA